MKKRGILVLLMACLLLLLLAIAHEEEEEHMEGSIEEPETIYHQILDNFTYIAIAAVVIAGILSAVYWKKGKKPKLSTLATYLVAVAVALGFLYSVAFYLESGVRERGIVIAEADGTYSLAIHIHADMHPIVCGEELKLPLQTGDTLMQPHTHNERNLIHWEGKLKSDAQGKILDNTPLKVGSFMDVMGTRLTYSCLGEKCNGDLCNGKLGKLTMDVNGVPNTEFREYVWKDGDVITLNFE